MPAHSNDTRNFDELSPRQQAAAISAMAINLGNAMAHRIGNASASSRRTVKAHAVEQLQNLARRIDAL
jgi:hypothetical protein